MIAADPQSARLLDLLAKHGRNLHSFMVLEPELSVWFAEDAAVAYTKRGGFWVAVGGPLCAPDQTLAVANAFRVAAREAGCKVVFFGVTQPLVDRLGSAYDSLLVGLAPVWSPAGWAEVVRSAEKLRNRLSKARRSGLAVRLLHGDEVSEGAPLRHELARIVNTWTDEKALPPMGFMVTLELFQHTALRRYFVVESGGTIHGFAVCVPIFGRNGWLLEDMIMTPGAPAGSSEALVDAVMRRLCDEGAEVVSLGMVALAGLDAGDAGGRHPMLTWILRFCSRTMGWLYNFEGLYRFRNKMKPTQWERVFVVSSEPASFWTIRAVLMAFANGWIPRFGVRVLGRWTRQWWIRKKATPPPQLVSRRSWIDVRVVALALACCFTTIIAVAGALQGWLPWFASVGLGFLASFAGFTPVHEAVHGNVCRVRAVNDAVGHVCSLLLTGALRPYRFLHREHHTHTNHSHADPDHWCAEGPWWALPLRWLTQDVGYLRFYLLRLRTRPLAEGLDLLACSCLYVGVAVSTFLLHPDWFYALCLGWFIPARLALFALAATFSWLPHAPHVATDRYLATTVRSSSWLTWLFLGQNFHLVHHLDPSIPFHRLAAAWDSSRVELLKRGAVDRGQ